LISCARFDAARESGILLGDLPYTLFVDELEFHHFDILIIRVLVLLFKATRSSITIQVNTNY